MDRLAFLAAAVAACTSFKTAFGATAPPYEMSFAFPLGPKGPLNQEVGKELLTKAITERFGRVITSASEQLPDGYGIVVDARRGGRQAQIVLAHREEQNDCFYRSQSEQPALDQEFATLSLVTEDLEHCLAKRTDKHRTDEDVAFGLTTSLDPEGWLSSEEMIDEFSVYLRNMFPGANLDLMKPSRIDGQIFLDYGRVIVSGDERHFLKVSLVNAIAPSTGVGFKAQFLLPYHSFDRDAHFERLHRLAKGARDCYDLRHGRL